MAAAQPGCRAPPRAEERQHGAVVQPVGQRRGGWHRRRPGCAPASSAAAAAPSCGLCAERRDGGDQHERGGEGHRRRAVLLAGARGSRWTWARAVERVVDAVVTATTVGRGSRFARSRDAHGLGAAAGLAHAHHQRVGSATAGSRKWRSSAASIMLAATPTDPSAGHGRVAGVVRAPDAGEDDVAASADRGEAPPGPGPRAAAGARRIASGCPAISAMIYQELS